MRAVINLLISATIRKSSSREINVLAFKATHRLLHPLAKLDANSSYFPTAYRLHFYQQVTKGRLGDAPLIVRPFLPRKNLPVCTPSCLAEKRNSFVSP